MKALSALVIVILLNCFNAEEDFGFRLKALEQEFATRLHQDDLRIRNLEETVKGQQKVLGDQWKTIQHLNDRLETQDNIIKRLEDGQSSVQEDKDPKSMGTPDEMRDIGVSTTVVKDTLGGLDETKKGDTFYRNQERILKHSAEKDGNGNSTSRANWTSKKDNRIDVHTTLLTKTNDQEPHNVGSKYSRAIESPVAFTAIKYQDQDGIGLNQNILFDRVILNDGGGYNVNHGIFTAPATGYYLFSTSIVHPYQATGDELHAYIMHNGVQIAMVRGNSLQVDQGTQTVVLKVRVGEQVWISHRDFTNGRVIGSYQSSFSGFLLYQL